MDEQNYFIIQFGAPFIYKTVYFKASTTLTPNTWNFICMQNKNNQGSIYLTNETTNYKIKNSVKFTGQGPIDYNKLSKKNKRYPLTNIPLYDMSSDIDFFYY